MVQYSMANLQQFQAKICLTASGCFIHDGKVLLIKHTKLGLWLNPGGHLEANEAPHQAAEREFFEETGIRTKAVLLYGAEAKGESQNVPSPFATNLHWVSKENYWGRVQAAGKAETVKQKVWERGCEQHLNMCFLVEPVGSIEYQMSPESTDIRWFSKEDLAALSPTEIPGDVLSEIEIARELQQRLQG